MKNDYDIRTINTPYWQHKRGSIGEIVTDTEDIEQCCDNIFNIIKGEVPYQPNIGTNITEAIGRNPKEALEIVRTIIFKEFSYQEPRIKIISVVSEYDENGKIVINIKFQNKETKEEKEKKYYVW